MHCLSATLFSNGRKSKFFGSRRTAPTCPAILNSARGMPWSWNTPSTSAVDTLYGSPPISPPMLLMTFPFTVDFLFSKLQSSPTTQHVVGAFTQSTSVHSQVPAPPLEPYMLMSRPPAFEPLSSKSSSPDHITVLNSTAWPLPLALMACAVLKMTFLVISPFWPHLERTQLDWPRSKRNPDLPAWCLGVMLSWTQFMRMRVFETVAAGSVDNPPSNCKSVL
mmetsp:Transcript_140055/g.390372  ORF Transcript_140055/g.390372 Transcript_140055/m.390372 type:complete len:221 (-) Transcript_140055:1712-2374(-)